MCRSISFGRVAISAEAAILTSSARRVCIKGKNSDSSASGLTFCAPGLLPSATSHLSVARNRESTALRDR